MWAVGQMGAVRGWDRLSYWDHTRGARPWEKKDTDRMGRGELDIWAYGLWPEKESLGEGEKGKLISPTN